MALLWLLSGLALVSGASERGCSTDLLPNGGLVVPSPQVLEYYCGTAIAPSWIVTAASCLRTSPNNVALFDGSTQNTKVFQNPLYNPQTKEYDIALIKVPSGEANAQAPSICLATGSEDSTYGRCVAFGLECTDASNKPVASEQIDVRLLDNKECRTKWNMPSSKICASVPDGHSCKVKTCGSLVCERKGRWFLVGITSCDNDSRSASTASTPLVYASVSQYLQWISVTIATY